MTNEILTCAKCGATARKGEPPFEKGEAKFENTITIHFCDECYAGGISAEEADRLLQDTLYSQSLETREKKSLQRRRVQEGTLISEPEIRGGATGPVGSTGPTGPPWREPLRRSHNPPSGPIGAVGPTGREPSRGEMVAPNPNRRVQEGTPIQPFSHMASSASFGFTTIGGPAIIFGATPIAPMATGWSPNLIICPVCQVSYSPNDITAEPIAINGRQLTNVCIYCHMANS